MMESYYRITLDIKTIQSQISLPIKQHDTSRGVYISLTDGGRPYTIGNDCFAVFNGKKPDGTEVRNNCYIENNRIVYPITGQTVAAPGIVECDVCLYNANGGLITTPRFTLVVDPRAVDGFDVLSSNEYWVLEKYLSDIQADEASRQEAITNFEERLGEFEAATAEMHGVVTNFGKRLDAIEDDYNDALTLVGGAE